MAKPGGLVAPGHFLALQMQHIALMFAAWIVRYDAVNLFPPPVRVPDVRAFLPSKYPQPVMGAEGYNMPGSTVGFRGTEEERFWRKVKISESSSYKGTPCLEWTAATIEGYGNFSLARKPGEKQNRWVKAHRWAYEKYVAPIPSGLEPDHLCRNPSCINPYHLEPVTPRVNKLRGTSPAANNARKQVCKYGHNDWALRPNGWRECRTCRKRINANRQNPGPLNADQRKARALKGWATRTRTV